MSPASAGGEFLFFTLAVSISPAKAVVMTHMNRGYNLIRKRGIVMIRFFKWFVVFGALGCIAMFFFYTLIIITMYNFHLLLLVMVMGVAMILAVVFAIIEKLDANIHKLEQMIKEQR